MKEHDLDGDARIRAIESLMGTLPDAETFEAELAARPALRAEVRSLRPLVEDLLASVPEAEPREDLWERIRTRISAGVQVWKSWRGARAGSMFLSRAADAEWEATSIAGVTALRLFVDEEADRVTMLVRMAPGSSYPAHRHAGPEECYVLEGDLTVGEVSMTAGDYQRMEAGSAHPIQTTRNGCLLHLSSSLRDELVA